MVGQEPLVRIRQKHSRSRTGCRTCRQRHIRCDEGRPCCLNCTQGSKVCDYGLIGEPLKVVSTKTKFPGVGAPWQITLQVSVSLADPFDALPIEMPFQSTDLLRHFMQTNVPIGNMVRPDLWKEDLSNSNSNATFCRILMLASSAFFAGRAGSLRQFESAYLHHKIESIREINRWLSNSKIQNKIQCMKLVGALLVSEAYLGNYAEAESHFSGLERLLELRSQSYHSRRDGNEDENEEEVALVERFSIFAQGIAKSTGNRSQRSTFSTPISLPPFETKLPRYANLLEQLRLTPYFLSTPKTEISRMVDGTAIIEELRYWVSILDPSQGTAAENSTTGDIAVIILHANQLHVGSIFGLHRDVSEANVLVEPISSWGTLVAARYCFLYGVLGMRKVGTPAAIKLLPHLSTLLLDDAESNFSSLLTARCSPALWIWKVFSAVVALLRFWDDLIELEGAQDIQQIQLLAKSHIKHWRRVQGIEHWYQVEIVLKRIVWPNTDFEDARFIWEAEGITV